MIREAIAAVVMIGAVSGGAIILGGSCATQTPAVSPTQPPQAMASEDGQVKLEVEPGRRIEMLPSPQIDWDESQIIPCVYVAKLARMRCMTTTEYDQLRESVLKSRGDEL